MKKKQWTKDQQDAISSRGGSLLVSAAAGSGKTAVLVQRVIERITDTLNPVDADRLMIVTFTNAAACEMRERISSALAELVSLEPDNIMLQRQQILLTHAHISTIHSFCSELIRENFYNLGVSSDFRIASSSELAILKNEALEQTLNEQYDKDDLEFFKFIEAFSGVKNDKKIEDIILNLYEFIRSNPFPQKWLREKLDMYKIKDNLSNTCWAKSIFKFARSSIDHAINIIKASIDSIYGDEKFCDAYLETLKSDLVAFKDLKDSINRENWDECYYKIANFKFERMKTLKGYADDPIKVKIFNNRSILKDTVKKLSNLFLYNESDVISDINQMEPIVRKLFESVEIFLEKLQKLKLEKNLLDFGDLEHLTLKLLVKPSSQGFEKTQEAISISKKFEEIMVDEYQDTNEIQDIIFKAISKDENNLFVVGDVKQSIYGFRQAMPEIFLKKKQEYELFDSGNPNYPAKVILKKNFRSRTGVTNAVNFVFGQLMSEDVGDMEYTDEEKLLPAASYPKRDIADMELHILEIEDEDMDTMEARHIASIIQEKIFKQEKIMENGEERCVTYRDFCILLMSANKHAANYARELKLCGIPAWSDIGGGFFSNIEVSTVLSLLRIIDNPIQDIPLISVLMSPIFGFSVDKLSQIRIKDRKNPLYLALKLKAGEGDRECINFIDEIDKYREIAATITADALINYIYDRTAYPSIVQAMDDGQSRLSNLRLLVDYAKNYEMSGNSGVFGFIKFIDKLQMREADLISTATVPESSNVVRIMTIHRSKGLEFPICIVAGCSRRFNTERGSALLHPYMGIGIKLRDIEEMTQKTTVPRESVALEISNDEMSENLRVLYVAMTRAKENLIMITSLKNIDKTLSNISAQLTDEYRISPYLVRNANSLSDLILYCALRHPSGRELRDISFAQPGIMLTDAQDWSIKLIKIVEDKLEDEKTEKLFLDYDENLIKAIKNRVNFEYSLTGLHNIPTKVSASELFEETRFNDQTFYNRPNVPIFIKNNKSSSAQKGTALHLFLEFADYKRAFNNLDGEIDRIYKSGFLSMDQIEILDRENLRCIFSSNLMNRIIRSDKFIREYRFVVDYKAGFIYDEISDELKDELVILQGAIDCIFIEDGKAVIVDYKSSGMKHDIEYKNKYSKQLNLYKYAVEKCLCLEVKECIIYSTALNKEIYVYNGKNS